MRFWLQNVGTTAPTAMFCVDQFPYVIGRRRECQGCLPYAFISRHHCEFTEDDGRVLLKDLESYNGTYVNGRPVRRARLRHGDELRIASHAMNVRIPK